MANRKTLYSCSNKNQPTGDGNADRRNFSAEANAKINSEQKRKNSQDSSSTSSATKNRQGSGSFFGWRNKTEHKKMNKEDHWKLQNEDRWDTLRLMAKIEKEADERAAEKKKFEDERKAFYEGSPEARLKKAQLSRMFQKVSIGPALKRKRPKWKRCKSPSLATIRE